MKEVRTNCIGFAYYALSLRNKDAFEYQPTLPEILKYFDITKKGDEVAIGILNNSTRGGFSPEILHLAIIDPDDKNFVIHRAIMDGAICREPLRKAIYEDYKITQFYPHLKVIRLKLKDQYLSSKRYDFNSLLLK